MEQLSWEEGGVLDRRRSRRHMIMVYKVKREEIGGMQNCLFVFFSPQTHNTRKMGHWMKLAGDKFKTDNSEK